MDAARRRREALELRPLAMELGTLPHDQHDGSALVSMGPVKALAAVSGPGEVRIRDEKTDSAALDVHVTPLQGIAGGTASTAFASAVERIAQSVLLLHLYPRSLVSIHLNTYASPAALVPRPIRSGRGAIPTAPPPPQPPHPDATLSVALQAAHINAMTCALLDASSVGMRAMVSAVSAAIVRKGVRANLMQGWRAGESSNQGAGQMNGSTGSDGDSSDDDHEDSFEIVLDPSPYEESLSRSTHICAFAFTRQDDSSNGAQRRQASGPDDGMDTDEGNDAASDRILAESLQGTLVYSLSQGSYGSAELLDVLALSRTACRDIIIEMRKTFASQRLGIRR